MTEMKLRTRLIIAFFLVAVIPIALTFFLNIRLERHAVTDLQLRELETQAALRAQHIEHDFENIKKTLRILPRSETLQLHAPGLIQATREKDTAAYAIAVVHIEQRLSQYPKIYDVIETVFLTDDEGTIVYAAGQDAAEFPLGLNIRQLAPGTLDNARHDLHISDLQQEPGGHQYLISAAPLKNQNGTFVGLVGFELNLDPTYAYLQDYTGLGRTGETLIGVDQKTHVTLINPTRYGSAGLNIPYGSEQAIPLQRASRGQTGSGVSIDYRGIPVYAAWRPIPSLNWALVVKRDYSEVLEPVTTLYYYNLIMFAILVILAASTGFIESSIHARPLTALTCAIQEISRGNFHTKLKRTNIAEYNVLIDAFERITATLKLAVKTCAAQQLFTNRPQTASPVKKKKGRS